MIDANRKKKIDYDSDDDDDEKSGSEYFDCFGNLEKKLKDNKCLLTNISFKFINIDHATRLLAQTFEIFQKEMSGKYGDHKIEKYPLYHRFCSIFDRRAHKKKTNKNGNNADEKLTHFSQRWSIFDILISKIIFICCVGFVLC